MMCRPTCLKLDEVCNFACVQVNTDGVVDLDHRIRVTDGAGIMGHQVWDSFCADEDFPHFAQLVLKQENDTRSKDLDLQVQIKVIWSCIISKHYTGLNSFPLFSRYLDMRWLSLRTIVFLILLGRCPRLVAYRFFHRDSHFKVTVNRGKNTFKAKARSS